MKAMKANKKSKEATQVPMTFHQMLYHLSVQCQRCQTSRVWLNRLQHRSICSHCGHRWDQSIKQPGAITYRP